MRLFVASIIALTIVAPSVAGDQVLYRNDARTPVSGPNGLQYRDGNFSDGFSSDGDNYYSTAFGQSFRIVADDPANPARLTRLTVWGASEYQASDPLSQTALDPNIVALEVSVFRIDTSQVYFPMVQNWIINISDVQQALTGTYVPGILSPVFQLDMALGGSYDFGTGDYLLTVGGILEDQEGESFAWIDGQRNGSTGGVGDRSYVTNGEVQSQWGVWLPIVGSDSSGSAVLYGVPAPGAIAALAIAGLRHRRRRS